MLPSSVAAADRHGSPVRKKSRNEWRNLSHSLWSIASHHASQTEDRRSSSRLLLAESPVFAPLNDFPVVSMFILTVQGCTSALKSWSSYQPAPSPCHHQVHGGPVLIHRTELLRSIGSAELQRAHGSPAGGCSGRGFIYGRGIQFLR